LPALVPFVERVWYFEGELPSRLERVLPNGRLQLLVNLDADELRTYHGDRLRQIERTGGVVLGGAQGSAVAIDTAEQRRVAGVSFRVGGSYPFFGASADALTDCHVELDRLWGRDGSVLRERLLEEESPAGVLAALERALLEQAVRPLALDRTVGGAVTLLATGVAVAAVTEQLGVSARRLTRAFGRQVGLTPKRFSRVARMQRAVRALAAVGAPREGWAAFAVDHGFYDQAHLIHEFRALTRMTPTEYAPRSADAVNHVVVAGSSRIHRISSA
jgi:AraC-like DNA-binding protein